MFVLCSMETSIITVVSGESCGEPVYSPVSSTASNMETVKLEEEYPELRFREMETQTDGVSKNEN